MFHQVIGAFCFQELPTFGTSTSEIGHVLVVQIRQNYTNDMIKVTRETIDYIHRYCVDGIKKHFARLTFLLQAAKRTLMQTDTEHIDKFRD